MRLHGVRAFCLAKLANSQAYGIAEDGNSKEREAKQAPLCFQLCHLPENDQWRKRERGVG